jgi:FKBP-type peptidyl-prolyl cis-trans isomerase FkpA
MTASFVRSLSALLVCAALSVLAASCGDSPTTPSTPTLTQTDLLVGTGAEATAGKTVSVHYTGWLFDSSKTDHKGLQFETSVGSNPFAFVLGAGQVIAGWDQGVPGMKVGGLRRLEIPSALAYGTTRNGPIPPNATLVFEIQLLEVK